MALLNVLYEGELITAIFPNGPARDAAGNVITVEREENHADVVAYREREAAVATPVIIISDRQFAQALRDRSVITQEEAVAFVATGTLPAQLVTLVAALPTQQVRDDAELLLAGATQFRIDHPLTPVLAAGFGWDAEDVLEFFAEAAAL